MEQLSVPSGDKGFNIQFTLTNYAGAAYDISTYTASLKYWKKGDPANPILTGACVIDDGPNGRCHYLVASGAFVTPGTYLAEIELTKTDVVESTEPFELIITESA